MSALHAVPTQCTNLANAEDTLQRVKIRGEWFTVPEAYSKCATSELERDQLFIDELKLQLKNDTYNTCARNSSPGAKPNSTDTKSLQKGIPQLLVVLHAPLMLF